MAGAFGKRNLNPADDVPKARTVARNKPEIHFERDDEAEGFAKYWPSYAIALASMVVIYVIGRRFGGLADADITYVLPSVAVTLAAFVLYGCLMIQNNFTVDKNSNSDSAKYPVAAVAGMLGGMVYCMFSLNLGLTGIFEIDWWGEMFATPGSGEATPKSWAIIETMVFGGGLLTFLLVIYNRFFGDREE